MSVEPLFDWLTKTFFAPRGEPLDAMEDAAVKALAGVLSPEHREKLARQLSRGRGVFRLTSGMIVEFLSKGLRDTDLFLSPEAEFTAAYVFCDGEKGQRCAVTVMRGSVACLHFALKRRKQPGGKPVSCDATLVSDLDATSYVDVASKGGHAGVGPSADIARKFDVRGIRPAKSEEQISAFLRFVGSSFPEDLPSVLHEFDGLKAKSWEFTGIQGRQIVWPDKRCLQVLAEDEQSAWALCLLVDSDSNQYLLVDQASADIKLVGPDFEPAIHAFVVAVGRTV